MSTLSSGSPWVFLFSKFTFEALLFEALIIFTLTALYSAFWILKKKKLGIVLSEEIPAGVVKYYLNELITDAEQVRAQLFGMLSNQGVGTPDHLSKFAAAPAASATVYAATSTTDATHSQAMTTLEGKLAEQTRQIEKFLAEKAQVEQELSAARAGSSAGDTDGAEQAKLRAKIAELEGRLAEYSVIEDDLANLKRLQQENAALRAQLLATKPAPALSPSPTELQDEQAIQTKVTPTSPTISSTAVIAAAPAVTETPAVNAAAPAVAETPAVNAAAPAVAETPAVNAAAPAVAETPAVNAAAPAVSTAPVKPDSPELAQSIAEVKAAPADPAAFEGLVDQVEKSLSIPVAPAATSSTTPVTAATITKSDADLVAEFEKMLSS